MIGTGSGDLVVVGAGGFGRETVEAVRAMNAGGASWRLLGYLDDDRRQGNRWSQTRCGGP
ncbi:MAG TPA: hypothetical protein VK600_00105 [Candidatus Saccharimonadales bacterium]|nr:hypothetical protein [Candidatus Saccharimonadales bacterium]